MFYEVVVSSIVSVYLKNLENTWVTTKPSTYTTFTELFITRYQHPCGGVLAMCHTIHKNYQHILSNKHEAGRKNFHVLTGRQISKEVVPLMNR